MYTSNYYINGNSLGYVAIYMIDNLQLLSKKVLCLVYNSDKIPSSTNAKERHPKMTLLNNVRLLGVEFYGCVKDHLYIRMDMGGYVDRDFLETYVNQFNELNGSKFIVDECSFIDPILEPEFEDCEAFPQVKGILLWHLDKGYLISQDRVEIYVKQIKETFEPFKHKYMKNILASMIA